MSIPKPLVTRLAKQHPHSAALLKAFIPLLEAQSALAGDLPAPRLPEADISGFTHGRPWLPPRTTDPLVYMDDAFLKAAPKKISSAAAKGFPHIKEDIKSISILISKNSDEAKEMILYRLKGEMGGLRDWAHKRAFNPEAAVLLASQLAVAAAGRVERAAGRLRIPEWGKNYCPICGNRPHASFLKPGDEHRSLQCSLCRHEWRFSPATCPVCGESDPRELPLFFPEERKIERAEACNTCRHYILGVDMREMPETEAVPGLYLICMMPLDLFMEEKGYAPAVAAG